MWRIQSPAGLETQVLNGMLLSYFRHEFERSANYNGHVFATIIY